MGESMAFLTLSPEPRTMWNNVIAYLLQCGVLSCMLSWTSWFYTLSDEKIKVNRYSPFLQKHWISRLASFPVLKLHKSCTKPVFVYPKMKLFHVPLSMASSDIFTQSYEFLLCVYSSVKTVYCLLLVDCVLVYTLGYYFSDLLAVLCAASQGSKTL